MKTRLNQRAFTATELMILIVVLGVLALLILPLFARTRSRSVHISCVDSLKQIGLAFRVWSGDNGDSFPMRYYTNADGTAQFADASNVFRYFQVMSNELNTPRILICPSDGRIPATNFTTDFDSGKISYFVGLDADEARPNMLLTGDRNVAIGGKQQGGLLVLSRDQKIGWTKKMHQGRGCICMADGSVDLISSSQLPNAVAKSGTNVNRLLFP